MLRHACNFSLQARRSNCLVVSISILTGYVIFLQAKAFGENQIKNIRNHLDTRDAKYITYPKFIFLCGKGFDKSVEDSYWNTNRGIIHRYMEKLLPDINVVLSEQLWEDGFDSKIDLLTFEEFLAEVSDAIILFVESPGSFCELGAFAYADSLFSDKMIVVLDEAYRNSRSFISTGPVLKASDNGSKVVYAEIKYGALLASEELRSVVLDLTSRMKTKISSINKRTINKDTNVYISSFIPEVLEIIRLAQPILSADLIQLYKDIKGIDTFTFIKRNGEAFSCEIQVTYIWKMLEVAQIVRIDEGYLSLLNYSKTQNFMLRYSGNAMDRERNRIICRKYRYGEKV